MPRHRQLISIAPSAGGGPFCCGLSAAYWCGSPSASQTRKRLFGRLPSRLPSLHQTSRLRLSFRRVLVGQPKPNQSARARVTPNTDTPKLRREDVCRLPSSPPTTRSLPAIRPVRSLIRGRRGWAIRSCKLGPSKKGTQRRLKHRL